MALHLILSIMRLVLMLIMSCKSTLNHVFAILTDLKLAKYRQGHGLNFFTMLTFHLATFTLFSNTFFEFYSFLIKFIITFSFYYINLRFFA